MYLNYSKTGHLCPVFYTLLRVSVDPRRKDFFVYN